MKLITHTLATVLLGASALVSAAPSFIGSWNLFDGPSWRDTAPVYTGQQAAAALFGGVASDYVISTMGSDLATIDFQSWYDQYGFEPAIFGQDYVSDAGEAGVYDAWYDASAFVRDHTNAQDDAQRYVNYAFRVDAAADVPEPMSVGLLGAGLLGMAFARRRRAARR